MSDPMDNRNDSQHDPRPKSVSPLVWLLLIVALLAIGWYFYTRTSANTASTATPETGVIEPTPESAAAQAERDAAARREARKPRQTASATKPRPAAPRLVDASPIASMSPHPDYPPAAQRRGETGTVVLRVDVGADGTPTNVDYVGRSGSQDLDRAAMNTVKKWKFNPAKRDGKAVASSVTVPVEFVLPGKG